MNAFWFGAAATLVTLLVPQSVTSLAPIQTCGTDAELAEPHQLTREHIILAADRRLFSPCRAGEHGPTHLEQRDLALLDQAAASRDVEFRRLAVQAYGRLGAPSIAPRIYKMLEDASPIVRREAVNAVGQALSGTRSDLRDDEPPTASEVTIGRTRLTDRLSQETDDEVVAMILATHRPDAS